jgi:hypothetical protein
MSSINYSAITGCYFVPLLKILQYKRTNIFRTIIEDCSLCIVSYGVKEIFTPNIGKLVS